MTKQEFDKWFNDNKDYPDFDWQEAHRLASEFERKPANEKKTSLEKVELMRAKMIAMSAVRKLKTIAGLIETRQLGDIEKFTKYSPSGDSMGTDKNFIDFSDATCVSDGFGFDIMELVEFLKVELKDEVAAKKDADKLEF